MGRRWALTATTVLLVGAGMGFASVGLRTVRLAAQEEEARAARRAQRVLEEMALHLAAGPAAWRVVPTFVAVRAPLRPQAWGLAQAGEEDRLRLAQGEWEEATGGDPRTAAGWFARVADRTSDPATKAFASLRAGVALRRAGDAGARERLEAAVAASTADAVVLGEIRWEVSVADVAQRHLAALDLAEGQVDAALDRVRIWMPDPPRISAAVPPEGAMGTGDLLGTLAQEAERMPGLAPRALGTLQAGAAWARRARENFAILGVRPVAVLPDSVLVRRDLTPAGADAVPACAEVSLAALSDDLAAFAAVTAPNAAGIVGRPQDLPRGAAFSAAPAPFEGLRLWALVQTDPTALAALPWALGGALAAYAAGVLLGVRAILASRRAARMQADFVAAVSHEMKTPIASVRAMAERIADGAVTEPDRARAYARRMEAEMTRLGATVRNVLDAARVERGVGVAVRPSPTDPAAVVREALEAARPAIEQRGFRVLAEVAPSPAPLPLDADAFTHVLNNLLDNAAKFSDEAREIEVRAGPADGVWRLEVLDRGPGVPPAERARVFDRFARGEDAKRRALPGVGLGLHVAREIVRAHGGTIRVEGREGGGARFVVELPETRR